MRVKLFICLLAVSCLSSSAFAARIGSGILVTPNPDRGDVVAGGGTCPGVQISSLPFSDAGTTCGSTNSVSSLGECTTDEYGGEDEVYQITLGAGNNVTFNLDLAGSAGDLAILILEACGDGSSCIGGADAGIGPGLSETLGPVTLPAGTYFVYIDSYYAAGTAGSCGNFTFSMSGTVPVELESFDVL